METSPPRAGEGKQPVGRTPREEPGSGRASLSSQRLLPQSRGLPKPERRAEKAPRPPEARGRAGRTLTTRGSRGSRANAEAPSGGGGKPDLIRTERSKGRLIRLPGSSLAPSGRRGGVTAGASRRSAEEREDGKGAFCARRGRGPSRSCTLGSDSRLRGWRETESGLRGRQANTRTPIVTETWEAARVEGPETRRGQGASSASTTSVACAAPSAKADAPAPPPLQAAAPALPPTELGLAWGPVRPRSPCFASSPPNCCVTTCPWQVT